MQIAWFLCGIFFISTLLLLVKIWFLKKDMNEIYIELKEHLETDTNTLLSCASQDKHIKHIVAELNKQLRLLRCQRHHFMKGSRELHDKMTNISHDLRTPITAICGYLDLLKQEQHSAHAQRYITIIHNRVEMLETLSEELFQYALTHTMDTSLKIKRVLINEQLEECIASFYATLQEHHIVPNIQLSNTKIYRTVDRTALSRVFSNLMHNALKYSEGDLTIHLSDTGEITFANTAFGLNEVDVGKLFHRFYTVETAKNATGIGLSIAHNLIEQMNGTICATYENHTLFVRINFTNDE